ncbi:hypothetical protein PtA15_7A830 [Puccinia triticina]|uniref:Uncharacterized protein n=1 Tax=Puccinia triticina TaxID=208348 RepID=A0ABY7CR13_9BASI|nr:uncharacterized protein PtA15_7A830 [Puccinia triticina]WAQ87099.1 hypothetical protein PtA15_7A830 [Puccinia triticina]
MQTSSHDHTPLKLLPRAFSEHCRPTNQQQSTSRNHGSDPSNTPSPLTYPARPFKPHLGPRSKPSRPPMILHICSKYTAVGRKEIIHFFYFYAVVTLS